MARSCDLMGSVAGHLFVLYIQSGEGDVGCGFLRFLLRPDVLIVVELPPRLVRLLGILKEARDQDQKDPYGGTNSWRSRKCIASIIEERNFPVSTKTVSAYASQVKRHIRDAIEAAACDNSACDNSDNVILIELIEQRQHLGYRLYESVDLVIR